MRPIWSLLQSGWEELGEARAGEDGWYVLEPRRLQRRY